jgi:hypothetical protein
MCNSDSSLSRLPQHFLLLHTLSVTYAAQVAHNWLTLWSGQKPKGTLRTPLLRLQNQMRKLTPMPPSNEPRHTLWLVKSPG